MTHDLHRPSGFVCRVERAKIVRVIDIDDLLRREFIPLPFSRDIHWFRTTEFQTVVRNWDGEIIAEKNLWSDYRNYLSSIDQAMEDAQAAVRVFGDVTGVVVTVHGNVVETPYLPAPEWMCKHQRLGRGDTALYVLRVPDDWCRDEPERVDRYLHALAHQEEDEAALFDDANRLQSIGAIKTPIVVWASNRSQEENEAALAELRALGPQNEETAA